MGKVRSTVARESLKVRLADLAATPPAEWGTAGAAARPNLHGILRYPAMMVPRMQGDIIDAVLEATSGHQHIIDPFVGSGTTLTESLLRGVTFTGVDINPLAALVCEAKLAIDRGADIELGAKRLMTEIGIGAPYDNFDFESRAKWFDDDVASKFGTLRSGICAEKDVNVRKILWVVFAETVRLCSNSRTSTYKLHKRREGDTVSAARVMTVFKENLDDTVRRVSAYRANILSRHAARPIASILCGDARKVNVGKLSADHLVLVTSPPYGDNTTTIPYGQFSYLALQWIPLTDLPAGVDPTLLNNTHAIDSASLGGSKKDAADKREAACIVSPTFTRFVEQAHSEKKLTDIGKVATFVYDYFEAMAQMQVLHKEVRSSVHWIITTGNRTAAGLVVPFDLITKDIVEFLGGQQLLAVHRKLPAKRMPSRNSLGSLINTETTLIAEFD
jgi:hypothetical protein